MKSISECRLYAIIDTGYLGTQDPVQVAHQMIRGGVDIIQVRAKDLSQDRIRDLTRCVHRITRVSGIPLILNDHPDLALELGVEGVHVGQDDLTVLETRKIVGDRCWIGKSTHSLEQALEAQEEDVQYIGVGPIFATPTKPTYVPVGLQLVQQVSKVVKVPFFCIGGIKFENFRQVISSGAERIVVVSGILQARDPEAYCRSLLW